MTVKPSMRWKEYRTGKNIFKPIVRQLEISGKKVLNLTAGDPVAHGFTNDEMDDFLIEAVKIGWNMYPHLSPWESRVKVAISRYEKKMRGNDFSPDDVIITAGVANALFVIHQSLLDPGDEVIAFDPSHYLGGPTSYWPCYGAIVQPCPSNGDEEWLVDPDELRSKVTEKTKAIFVNNPNNPTGAVYDERFIKNVVDIAGENDLLLIGDEIYGSIVYDGEKAPSLGSMAGDVPTIVVNGISKYFIKTGWRLGYICLHDPDEKAASLMSTIKSTASAYGHASKGVPTPIMAATAMAMERAPLIASTNMVKELQLRRDYIMSRIKDIESLSCVKPKGALYAFPKIELVPKIWKSDKDFLLDLLKEEQLLCNDGSSYGKEGSGHFRTLLMPKIEIQEDVFNRIERMLKRHAAHQR